MKLTLTPTQEIVTLARVIAPNTQARIWHGVDEHGAPVQALIMRVAVALSEPPEVHERFAAALRETPDPLTQPRAFDFRHFVD